MKEKKFNTVYKQLGFRKKHLEEKKLEEEAELNKL